MTLHNQRQQVHPSPPARESQQCAFCGYDIPTVPIRGSSGLIFCSEGCRNAYEGGDEPFAGRLGFRQFVTGVSALDKLLPWGLPANSFVLLAGPEGIRHRSLQTELVWRALNRGECGIIITFVDPPVAVVEHFLAFGWNVLPYLESGALQIIDCFTNRLREEHQSPDQQVKWNAFLANFLDEAVTTVRDTTDLREVENKLHKKLKERKMVGSGLVVIDSLNEIKVQGYELEAEQFIKEVRGDVCKRKFVPIFASTTVTEETRFLQDYSYLFDGIVDMQKNETLFPDVRLKQLSIRKMDGVGYHPYWATYKNTGNGFEIYDPEEELDSEYVSPSGTFIGY